MKHVDSHMVICVMFSQSRFTFGLMTDSNMEVHACLCYFIFKCSTHVMFACKVGISSTFSHRIYFYSGEKSFQAPLLKTSNSFPNILKFVILPSINILKSSRVALGRGSIPTVLISQSAVILETTRKKKKEKEN